MNFAAIVEEFLAKEALVQLPELKVPEIAAKLSRTFAGLLENRERRERLAENAFALVQAGSGATARTMDHLKLLLKKAPG